RGVAGGWAEPSDWGRGGGLAARGRQARRYAGEPWRANAELPNAALAAHCRLDRGGHALLERAVAGLGLSMRGFVRSLRLARTLADLDGADAPAAAHVAEALSFRGAIRWSVYSG